MHTDPNTAKRHRAIPAMADTGQPGPPPLRPPIRGVPISPRPQKSSNSCLIAGAVALAVAFVMVIVVGILAAIMLPALSRAREAARRASCMNNLKQMGLVYKMWANEHKEGAYPPLAAIKGDLCFNPDDVYPEYLTDPLVMECPSDPTRPVGSDPQTLLDDESYFYLGYAVTTDAEAEAFIEAYKKRIAEGGNFEDDLTVPAGTGTGGGDRILRLGERMGRSAESEPNVSTVQIPDQNQVPIMFDREGIHHVPGGINVIYMDGHVEFLKMGSKFPAQQWFLDALAQLEP